MNHYTITVIHNGDPVQVYPPQSGRVIDEWKAIYRCIGAMVMSNGITELTVYRDGAVFRHCTITGEEQPHDPSH